VLGWTREQKDQWLRTGIDQLMDRSRWDVEYIAVLNLDFCYVCGTVGLPGSDHPLTAEDDVKLIALAVVVRSYRFSWRDLGRVVRASGIFQHGRYANANGGIVNHLAGQLLKGVTGRDRRGAKI
jgi:hypothetical protein